MKFFQSLVFFAVVFTAESKRLLCGPVTPECVRPLPNLKCPKVPFCPENAPRVMSDAGCCCSSLTTQATELSKAKIMSETIDALEVYYLKARLDIDVLKATSRDDRIHEIIDGASKSISDAMVRGMKNLASLADVEFFEVLPQVFGDDQVEQSEKGQEIVEEVKRIYERGEEYFEIFQKISNGLDGK